MRYRALHPRRLPSLLPPLLLALVPALPGCGDDGGAGVETEGRVSATVQDGSAASAGTSSSPRGTASQEGSFAGTLTAEARVSIRSDADGWVELDAPEEITVALRTGEETTVVTEATVPVGTYTRVRLEMDGTEVFLAAGAIVDGLVLDAGVSIVVGGAGGTVVIEKEAPAFTVDASSTTTVAFDLDSEAWLTAESVSSETVAEAAVQSATSVRVE